MFFEKLLDKEQEFNNLFNYESIFKPILPFINKFIFAILAFMTWFKVVDKTITFYSCTEHRSLKQREYLDVILHIMNVYFDPDKQKMNACIAFYLSSTIITALPNKVTFFLR